MMKTTANHVVCFPPRRWLAQRRFFQPHGLCVATGHRLVMLTLMFAVSAAVAALGSVAEPSPAELPTGADSIPRAVQQEIDAGLFPGAVVLVGRPGRVLYEGAFGHARIVPDKVKMRKDHVFDLASVTKVVATGTAFGICVDDGRLRFDMPIAEALPQLSGTGIGPITVAQLATHTSGFDNAKYCQRAQGEAMLDLMLAVSPQWKPGSRFYYSCLNMILLGRMVERASGQRLDAFCQARIFQPLGMHDTSFGPLRPSPRVVPSGAPEIGQIEDEQARVAGRAVGNAGLFSTAADLARFCEMMLGEGRLDDVRIVSQQSHRWMTRNHLAPPLPARGFAWEMDLQALHRPKRLSEKAYGHSGHTGQSIWIDPEKQVYVIVLTNRNHPKMVGGERKTQQYQARARIGDAALRLLGY
jgi:serine-type D-Ala-D-Ala carboxypeptidase